MLFADAKIAEPCEIHPLHSKPCPICASLEKGLTICKFCSKGIIPPSLMLTGDEEYEFCNYICLRHWVVKKVGF